jgi:deoxyadenosine/deoxycytidine kinase
MLPGKYIVIEGNIGAGKTSLANMLAKQFNGSLVLEEFAENTFLPQFYKDPERFAFPLEMSFMAERYGQLKRIFNSHEGNKPVVSDFLFDKSLLFAKVNLKADEFRLFESFFNLVKDSIPKPDLLVYLQKEVGHLKKNIEKRGRDFEKAIGNDYLKNINESYNDFVVSDKSIKKLIINSSDIDFVANKKDYEDVVNKILGF